MVSTLLNSCRQLTYSPPIYAMVPSRPSQEPLRNSSQCLNGNGITGDHVPDTVQKRTQAFLHSQKHIFSGCERSTLRVPLPFHFLSQFRLVRHIATCGFSCPALNTERILSKNSRQTSFGTFTHHSYESFYLSVPFLLSHSCFLTFHVLFVRALFVCTLDTRIWGFAASTMIRHTLCGKTCEVKSLCS
jgi:hypothetical protein